MTPLTKSLTLFHVLLKKPSELAALFSSSEISDVSLAEPSKCSPDTAMNAASGSKDATSRSLSLREWVEEDAMVDEPEPFRDLDTRMIHWGFAVVTVA